MGKKTKGGGNLGRQLIKDRFGHTPRRKVDNDTMVRNIRCYHLFIYTISKLTFLYFFSCTQLSYRMDTTGVV